jgi:hypothetical protein
MQILCILVNSLPSCGCSWSILHACFHCIWGPGLKLKYIVVDPIEIILVYHFTNYSIRNSQAKKKCSEYLCSLSLYGEAHIRGYYSMGQAFYTLTLDFRKQPKIELNHC